MKWITIIVFSIVVISGMSCNRIKHYDESLLLADTLYQAQGRTILVYFKDAWIYSPHPVQVYVRTKSGFDQHIFSTELYNDGAVLMPGSNVLIQWKNPEKAIITFSGQEQQPEIHEITFTRNIQHRKLSKDRY